MVVFINAGGSPSYPNGDSFVVCSSNVEVALFKSANMGASGVRFGDDAVGNTIVSSGGVLTFAFGTSNAPKTLATMVTLANRAMMGVNTPNPQYTLDVSGDINLSGNILVNGQTVANNLYTFSYNTKASVGLDFSMVVMGQPSSSNSLYVPYGDGAFGGAGTFGGNGQFGGACAVGGNGTFGGVVAAPFVQTDALRSKGVEASFDKGATDAKFVRAVVAPNASADAYAIANANGRVYTSFYNTNNQIAYALMHSTVAPNAAGSNITVTYTDCPITSAGLSSVVFAGVNRKSGGVGYISAGSSVVASTPNHAYGDGYVAAFTSNGAYAWSARVQGGVPTSVACSADGLYVATAGTFNSSLTFTDAHGASRELSPIDGSPGAYLATLSSSGALVSALTYAGFVSQPSVRFDGAGGVAWTGSFSNALNCTYGAKTFVVSACNAIYTSNLVPNTLYPPYLGSNLVVTLTSNIWTSNAFTTLCASANTSTPTTVQLTFVGTTPTDVSVSPTMNYATASNMQTSTFQLAVDSKFSGYSNAYVASVDVSGNAAWFAQIGGSSTAPQLAVSARSACAFTAHTAPFMSNVGLWNLSGLINQYASQQSVVPDTLTIPATATAVVARNLNDGSMRFANQLPASITCMVADDANASLLIATSSNAIQKWDTVSGSNLITFTPAPSSTLVSIAADVANGSMAVLGSNVASLPVMPVFPNGDPFSTSLPTTTEFFFVNYPSYLMMPSSTQVTQRSTFAPAFQAVQAGSGPVARFISVASSSNNILEGYGQWAVPVFTVSSGGNVTAISNIACYSLSNQNVYAASSLQAPGQASLNAVTASNVAVFGASTASVASCQQLSCANTFALAGCLAGSAGGGVTCAATTFDVNCARMSASNVVHLGGGDANTMVITPGNVVISNNLTTTALASSTVTASTSVTTPVVVASGSITVASTGGTCLFAACNYNNTGLPFVGIGTASQPQLASTSYALVVKGSGYFDSVYTSTLTVGNNLLSTTDAALLILGGTAPTFTGTPANCTFGGLFPTVPKSEFAMYGGAGAMFTKVYCLGTMYSQACGIGPFNMGIGTKCSITANPAYMLDVSGNARATTFTGNIDTSNVSSGILPVARGGSGAGSIAAGQIMFGGTSAVSQSPNLYWNSANNRMGINTTTPTYDLEVIGSIGVTGDISALYSDDRLKNRVGRLEKALDKISTLTAFTYKNNDVARSFGFTDDRTRVGLSAQDVAAVLPEAVRLAPFDRVLVNDVEQSKTGQHYITVQYDQIVPLLVAAVQELRGIVDDLIKK